MLHPRYRLIIADIDGCLAPEGSHPFDLPSLARIAEFNRRLQAVNDSAGDPAGITLCSGRPQPFAEAMCKLIGNMNLPCVCENGVWLYHPDSNHYDMDPAITSTHLDAVRDAAAFLRTEHGPHGVSQQPGKAASISLYHKDPAHLRALAPRLAEEFARRGYPFRVSMTWLYINCDLEHISKATGLDRLLDHIGYGRDTIAGIGDTAGDLPIRDRTAFFACPANASDDIKPRADYISDRPEAQGVVDILTRLVQ